MNINKKWYPMPLKEKKNAHKILFYIQKTFKIIKNSAKFHENQEQFDVIRLTRMLPSHGFSKGAESKLLTMYLRGNPAEETYPEETAGFCIQRMQFINALCCK